LRRIHGLTDVDRSDTTPNLEHENILKIKNR